MLPIIQIGPLAIQAPELIIIIGVWFGLSLSERLSPRTQTDSTILYNLVFVVFVAGIVGARLIYSIQHFNIFITVPLNLISLNPGLLDPFGGVATGLIVGWIYCNRKNIPLWNTLDGLTPLFAVLVISIGLSQFASGDAFGIVSNVPWGIELWGAKRHPTQIYTIITGLVVLSIIWPRQGKPGSNSKQPGNIFLSFIALSAGMHLFLEAFRGDSSIFIYNIRTSQVGAWILLAISLWGRLKLNNNHAQKLTGEIQ